MCQTSNTDRVSHMKEILFNLKDFNLAGPMVGIVRVAVRRPNYEML